MSLARRATRIRTGDHDLQSLQQVVAARALAAAVRADCSFWRCSSRTQPRQLACESAPLGSRRKRGEWAQAVGRSRGGRTSKIHCLADDRGRPVAFALTPGNVADISMAVLIERLFCRLKNWRRLATRYDRLARNYLAALALVAVVT